MGIALGVVLPAEILLGLLVHLRSGGGWLSTAYGLLILAAALWYCQWRPLPRLIEACELAIWAVVFSDVLAILIQIAGRSPRPLVDSQLAGLDARLHFQTSSAVHLAAHLHGLKIGLGLSYALVSPLVIIAVLLLPFCGYATSARRFIVAIVVAAFLTAAMFALWPAAGPWRTEGFRPTATQARITAYLLLLKSHAAVALDMQDAGIVAFPSFHVVLAILSAAALSSIRVLRILVWVIAALICASTLTTGWHYLVDVAAGLAVAAVSILAAQYLLPYPTAADRQVGEVSDEWAALRELHPSTVLSPLAHGDRGDPGERS